MDERRRTELEEWVRANPSPFHIDEVAQPSPPPPVRRLVRPTDADKGPRELGEKP